MIYHRGDAKEKKRVFGFASLPPANRILSVSCAFLRASLIANYLRNCGILIHTTCLFALLPERNKKAIHFRRVRHSLARHLSTAAVDHRFALAAKEM